VPAGKAFIGYNHICPVFIPVKTMEGLIFSAPYNDDTETLDALLGIENHGQNRLAEIYLSGPQLFSGSGRITPETGEQQFFEVVDRIRAAGIRANLVMNATCEGSQWYSKETVKTTLAYLGRAHEQHGVEAVTLSNPLYIKAVRRSFPGLEICASVLANIDCVQRAVIYRDAGADIITPDANINRNLELLKDIKQATGARLKLLANEGCLYKCPFRQFHFNAKSHISREVACGDIDVSFADFFGAGTSVIDRDRSQLLKSPWIRPEDLRAYSEITPYFKLVCRSQRLSFVLRVVRAYIQEYWDGDLLDLVSGCSRRFSINAGAYLSNKLLGESGFFKTVTACSVKCATCSYCGQLADELIALSVYTPEKAADSGEQYSD
jgi:collagenase-like PrtC family protease